MSEQNNKISPEEGSRIDKFFNNISEAHKEENGKVKKKDVNDVDTSHFLEDLEAFTGRNFSKGKNGHENDSKQEYRIDSDNLKDDIDANSQKFEGKKPEEIKEKKQEADVEKKEAKLSDEPYERIHRTHHSDYKDLDKYAEVDHYGKKKKKKRKSRFSKGQKAVIIILLIILFLAIAAVGSYFILNKVGENQMKGGVVDVNYGSDIVEYQGKKYRYNPNVVSIAFMGVDKENFDVKRDKHNIAGQSDFNLVIAFNTETGKTDFIAFPRDSLVDVDRYDSAGNFIDTEEMQLCLAYSYGDGGETSCENAARSMSRILYGVPIASYAVLNIDGISVLNDAIGGVTVTSTQTFGDTFYEGETYTLMSELAEKYIRSRSGGIDSDAKRRERQLQYVKAFANQTIDMVQDDFGVVGDLYSAAQPYMETNIGLSQLTYSATTFLRTNASISFDNMVTISGTLQTGKGGYVETVIDKDAALKTVIDIYYTEIG